MTGENWGTVRTILMDFAATCASFDEDGLDVAYMNHKSNKNGPDGTFNDGYYGLDASAVQSTFATVGPFGGTPLGGRLQSMVQPYLTKLKTDRNQKPRLLIVFTDGAPTDGVVTETTIRDAAATPNQLGLPNTNSASSSSKSATNLTRHST